MERNLAASTLDRRVPGDGGPERSLPSRLRGASNRSRGDQPPHGEPGLALAPTHSHTHTLVLTGELHYRSAHTLEKEIERLCAEDVTAIRLDLRRLTYIDSIGVAVIAFRSGLCQRRGFGFAVIPGSRLVHRAFEQAGVSDLLPFEDDMDAPQTSRLGAQRPLSRRVRAVFGGGRGAEA
jgi:anti-sigma B factor antagonist